MTVPYQSQQSQLWVVMPVLAHPAYTEAAISDVLAQTAACRLLVVNQGVDTPFRQRLERLAEAHADRLFLWSHQPPLPSLAATWNRALDFCWQSGARCALVINNDVRLAPNTLDLLRLELESEDALLVTGVGVSQKQFQPGQLALLAQDMGHGGPDFSCFLIAKDCHARFRFDEAFIPAFCEDVDFHRRLLLAGEGRRIYGINVPFLHYGSTTLKTVDSKTRARLEEQITRVARAYYQQKWGGPVNQEAGDTTPALQEAAWASALKI